MKLSVFMAAHAPRAGYTGCLFGEDWVLALDIEGGAADGDFAVARAGLRRLEAGFETREWQGYGERDGPFARRLALRRCFLLEGDRRLDDPLQRRLFCYDTLFARGDGAAMRYLFFSLRDGSGERGRLLPLIERDAGGAPGECAAFRLRLVQSGETPEAYCWEGSLPG